MVVAILIIELVSCFGEKARFTAGRGPSQKINALATIPA